MDARISDFRIKIKSIRGLQFSYIYCTLRKLVLILSTILLYHKIGKALLSTADR